MERIKAAAIKLECGEGITLPPPYRHHDILLGIRSHAFIFVDSVQGFITTNGNRFADRAEANEVAKTAGQLVRETGTPGLCIRRICGSHISKSTLRIASRRFARSSWV
jgi:hypothetical protein